MTEPLKILTLENDQDVQNFLGDVLLISLRAKQIQAYTVNQALKLAAEEKPNVITVDLDLPQKNGWTFLDELAKTPTIADIPTIIVSVLNPSLIKPKAEAMGIPFVYSLDIVEQLPPAILASISRTPQSNS